MKAKIKISFGVAALVAAGMIGFVPASAQKGDVVASVAVKMTAIIENSVETPQDEVWDMTYGSQRPVFIEDSVALEDSIVDYTFG
jgi:hypothetical protein